MSAIGLIESTEKPRKRLFEAGEMKLLVLHFILQQPKYSYDIIKDVANLVGGNYKPSTGTICPTINYLEEQQYTSVQIGADERKQYQITQKGIEHLSAQQVPLQKALDRFNTRRQIQSDARYEPIKNAMEQLKTALRSNIHGNEPNAEHITQIAEAIQHAAVNVRQLANTEEKP